MTQIRLLDESDAAAWRELRLRGLQFDPEAFGQTYEEAIAQSLEDVIPRLSPAAFEHVPIFGAFRDGVLVGTCGLMREPRVKKWHKAALWGMFVAPEARSLGVGGELVKSAIAHARTMPGVLQVSLAVVTTNEGARRLYERHGFRLYGIEPRALRHEGVDFDDALMVRMLDAE